MRGTIRSGIARAIIVTALLSSIATAGAAYLAGSTDPLVLATIVAVIVTLAVIVGLAAARRQTVTLERLAAAAASFAAGNLDVRAKVEGPREVRLIADSFNRMAEEVSAALQQVTAEERRKTQFVSDVSHELRTPLTAIRGAAETLLDGDVAPDDQERFLSTIAMEAERLTRLANDLLAAPAHRGRDR